MSDFDEFFGDDEDDDTFGYEDSFEDEYEDDFDRFESPEAYQEHEFEEDEVHGGDFDPNDWSDNYDDMEADEWQEQYGITEDYEDEDEYEYYDDEELEYLEDDYFDEM